MMSHELMKRARELLALREKATPILGNCGCYNESDTTFRASGHDMADAIAALLAEVERLTAALADVKALAIKLDADRADLSVRAEAAESRLRELASAEAVRYEYEWFDPGLGRYDENWGPLCPRRGQTMEQKLAEIESYQRTDGNGPIYRVRALIRRPEMPS